MTDTEWTTDRPLRYDAANDNVWYWATDNPDDTVRFVLQYAEARVAHETAELRAMVESLKYTLSLVEGEYEAWRAEAERLAAVLERLCPAVDSGDSEATP